MATGKWHPGIFSFAFIRTSWLTCPGLVIGHWQMVHCSLVSVRLHPTPPDQMLVWVEEGIRKKLGSLAARGRCAPAVTDYFVDAQFLGGPARSGQRRVLFTTAREDIARLAIDIARRWW